MNGYYIRQIKWPMIMTFIQWFAFLLSTAECQHDWLRVRLWWDRVRLISDLKQNNITTDMYFEWLHPLEGNVEWYARFLQQSFEDNSILEDEILCNCSSNNFSTNCSFERTKESTIEEVLLWQLSHPVERDMGLITCFVIHGAFNIIVVFSV